MLAVFTALFSSRSKRSTFDGAVHSPAGPYRTPAVRPDVPQCLDCGPLEAAGLRAYMGAGEWARAAATELLVCQCGRACGVRV